MSIYPEGELDAVAELLERAETQGHLTLDDVLEAFPEAEENLDQLEEVFIYFQTAGIDVHEGERGEITDKDEVKAGKARAGEEETAEKDIFDLSGISSDDSIGLYLKEMARVPLLSTQEEVRLA